MRKLTALWVVLILAAALAGCTHSEEVFVGERDLFVIPLEQSGHLQIVLKEGAFVLVNPEQATVGCYRLTFEGGPGYDGLAEWLGNNCAE